VTAQDRDAQVVTAPSEEPRTQNAFLLERIQVLWSVVYVSESG